MSVLQVSDNVGKEHYPTSRRESCNFTNILFLGKCQIHRTRAPNRDPDSKSTNTTSGRGVILSNLDKRILVKKLSLAKPDKNNLQITSYFQATLLSKGTLPVFFFISLHRTGILEHKCNWLFQIHNLIGICFMVLRTWRNQPSSHFLWIEDHPN